MAFGSAPRGIPRILQWLLAGLMLLIGLAVGGLGFKLATVGGSCYFLIMGVVMVIAAILIFLNRTSGIVLYGIAFIASLFWAVSDAGWDFWPLFSRLFTFAVLAFLCAIVWPFLRGQTTIPQQGACFWRRGGARGGDAGQPWLDV
jgi:quinate dehydrogenase (quinone)